MMPMIWQRENLFVFRKVWVAEIGLIGKQKNTNLPGFSYTFTTARDWSMLLNVWLKLFSWGWAFSPSVGCSIWQKGVLTKKTWTILVKIKTIWLNCRYSANIASPVLSLARWTYWWHNLAAGLKELLIFRGQIDWRRQAPICNSSILETLVLVLLIGHPQCNHSIANCVAKHITSILSSIQF